MNPTIPVRAWFDANKRIRRVSDFPKDAIDSLVAWGGILDPELTEEFFEWCYEFGRYSKPPDS